MRTVLVTVVLVLAGCATTETVWVRSGASEQDFYQDRGQCQAQAFSVPGAPMMQAAIVFSGCMQGKGWRQEQQRR
jgi:hypothetical protein